MRIPRRRFLHLTAGAAALSTMPRRARALDYPVRPVRIIVGFAPNGAGDIIARLIAQWLTDHLGHSFVVENKPGAATNIATEMVARAVPDGYTLLNVTTLNAWNATLYKNLHFNFIRDIVPVASMTRAGGVLEVNPSVPAQSVPEFIAYAKANPGKLNMATGGVGSGPHLYGELFKMMTGVDLVPVHYHGSGPALPDLISGRDQVMFDQVTSSIGFIRAGKLRPLGVTTAKPYEVLPDIPPIANFVPGYEASGWQGIGAPKDTPGEIVEKLHTEINKALADPTFKGRLTDLGAPVFASSPAEFSDVIAADTEKWSKVIKFAGIKARE